MAKKPTLPKENKPDESKSDPDFEESRSGALQMLSNSDFDVEIKKEFGKKIKTTKTLEELTNTMNNFLNYIADKLKSKSARQESKEISDGTPEKHLGKHSLETVGQELFSLENTRPMFRDSKWHKRAKNIRDVCLNEISNGDSHFQNSLIQLNLIEDMR